MAFVDTNIIHHQASPNEKYCFFMDFVSGKNEENQQKYQFLQKHTHKIIFFGRNIVYYCYIRYKLYELICISKNCRLVYTLMGVWGVLPSEVLYLDGLKVQFTELLTAAKKKNNIFPYW